MALIDRVADRRAVAEVERSTDPVTMEEFGYLLSAGNGNSSRTRSGVAIGPRRALGLSAWYSGVKYIAETMAGLPVKTYRDTPAGRVERADPLWKRNPDVETPWFALIEFFLMSLLNKGNAYAFKLRNTAGQVTGLRPIHPDRVKVGQASDGSKVFQLDGRRDVAFTTRELVHIPGLSYDGVVGMNPLQYHAETLGLAAAAEEAASRSFGQGVMEKAYLSLPQTLTEQQADDLAAVWQAQHAGLVNAGKLAVMGGGAEYKTIGLSPESTQLLESRKFSVTEVCRILRLTPHKLYDLDRATFSNIEQQAIEDTVDGIRPWCTRLEAWLNYDPDLTPPRNFIEWNIEGLLRGDVKSRYEAYGAGIAGGFLMPSEPRAKENLPYIEGSEFLVTPMNMTPFGPDAAALPTPAPTPAPTPPGAAA